MMARAFFVEDDIGSDDGCIEAVVVGDVVGIDTVG